MSTPRAMVGQAPDGGREGPDSGGERPDIEISPYAVVRAAAWPIETLDAFAAPALAALARDVIGATASVAAGRVAVTDGLATVVPLLTSAVERGVVLGARRALHRADAPLPDVSAVVGLVQVHDPGLAADLVVDHARRTRGAALARELADAHAEASAAERRALRRATTTPEFLTALSVARPALAGRWRSLVAAEAAAPEAAAPEAGDVEAVAPLEPGRRVTARVRRLELAVFGHLCRAVGRVVPSSCWAGVVPVLPAAGAGTGFDAHPAPPQVRVEPDLSAFEEVVPLLAARRSVGAGHPLRIDPKLAADEGATAHPLRRVLVEAFGTEVRTASGLIGTLARALGGSAEVEARLTAALNDLIVHGVVVSAAVVPRGADDAWAALDAVAPLLGEPERARWTGFLAALRDVCGDLAGAVVDARPDAAAGALRAAAELVEELRDHAGAGSWATPPVRVVTRLPLDVDWDPGARARTRDAVRTVLARFAADGVAEAYRRASVVSLAAALGDPPGGPSPSPVDLLGRPPFVARGPRQAGRDADTWIGAAARLGDAGLVARAGAAAATWEQAIPFGRPEARLPHVTPIEDAATRPGPYGSLRFELGADELVFRAGRPEPGFGAQGRAEWFPGLDAELRGWLADWGDEGVDAVELVGADPGNPNAALGPPLASQRIGPVAGGLDPRLVAVEIDGEARPFLVERDADGRPRTGRRLVPLHPQASAVGSANPLTAGLWRMGQAQGWEWVGMGVPLLPAELAPDSGGLPRLVAAPGVVLAARRWVLDPEELSGLIAASGSDRYLAWRRIAERLDLPPLVLVRTGADPETPERLVGTDSPLGVDALVEHLEAERVDAGRVVVRALPADRERWPVRSTGGHHLAEIVVSWHDRAFWRAVPGAPLVPAVGEATPRPVDWHQVVWAVPAQAGGAVPAVPWTLLAATVADLTAAGASQVWYARKTGIRLRAFGAGDAIEPVLRLRSEQGVRSGEILRVTTPVYEPELARFGGAEGLALAHELFHRDTPLALDELGLDPGAAPVLHRVALAVAVADDLFAHVLLDRAEAWDVWQGLDALARAQVPETPEALVTFGPRDVVEIVADPAHRLVPALRPSLRDGLALAADVAPRLREMALDGTLQVGVRAWLTAASLFAWNRRDFGLHPAALATATSAAVLRTEP